jgi:hypothetical protein
VKRISIILLTVYYLLTTAGIAVSLHFCCGQIEYIKILTEIGSCNHHHQQLPDDCCDEKTYFYQNSQEQILKDDYKYIFSNHDSFVKVINPSTNHHIISGKGVVCKDDNLLPSRMQSLWLLHCSLTYYG